ncbi:MAG: cation:proton antiporter [Candidatus Competibacteraceae bacterium]|nr:cation:proton antiporter [Candidatus Competibacteraceae bacterium]
MTTSPTVFELWCLIVGALLIAMALSGTLLKRLPISSALLYLGVGYGLGPGGLAFLSPDPFAHTVLLERMAEIAVLISLFAVGLKLELPLASKRWRLPVRLASVSMVLTVALIALIGVEGLGLSPGAAILLGAILAPTDPVLASDVQVTEASARDRLRLSLTGEGALNDGAAFPFVMLGLGLLGLHELGESGWRWVAVDVVWSIAAGLAIGGGLGWLIGKLVVYLRKRHRESVGLEEFLALGLIALSYGLALVCHSYGFLAVFAAGIALGRVKEPAGHRELPAVANGLSPQDAKEKLATHPELAGVYLTREVLNFNEQLERIAEVALVLVVGAMLSYVTLPANIVGFCLLLFLVVRPLSVYIGLIGAPVGDNQRALIAWFGIRGIGSIYYLMYAINHELPRDIAEQLLAFTLPAVAASIVLHGISVTPLMARYTRKGAEAGG